MIKCPFCHFDNEDGALFCERCTSDLTAVTVKSSSSPPPPPPPVVPAIPVAEAIPYTASPFVAEAVPFTATPLDAEPLEGIPLAPLAPIDLQPIDLQPIALEPVSAPPSAASTIPAVDLTPAAMPPPPPSTPAPAHSAATPAAETPPGTLPPNAQPRLLVLRGQKRNVEYPIYEGSNFLGRADEKPVDIDLEEQEPPDRIWCSRQHACIHWEDGQLLLEDLNSANGTYVNRTRVYPGQKRPLAVNDVLQIGNVQLKVLA